MRIVFRVDSSFKIATGHVMRCLTLADELKQRGGEVEFVSRDLEGNISSAITQKGLKLHLLPRLDTLNENYCVHAHWLEANWRSDANETLAIAKGADWLVVDHYAIDERWEKLLRPHVGKIMLIDDLADRKHDCDMLLDQNYYHNAAERYDELVPQNIRLLLTPKYSLLRPEFAEARKKRTEKNIPSKKIAVFFGGVDRRNDTAKAVEALRGFEGEVKIIAGGANQHFAELEKLCSGITNFTLYRTANISELMLWADVVVGFVGGAGWERACLGLPGFGWAIADNHAKILEDLDSLGAFKLTAPATLLDDILNADLTAMSKISMALTDGKGAARVANSMAFELRKAGINDSEKIWQIRNEQTVRENSLNHEIIPFEVHKKWYETSLVNNKRYILLLTDKHDIAGVLRFDVEGNSAGISIYLNLPRYHNLSLGENLLERGFEFMTRRQPEIKIWRAQILDNNLKSKQLFTRFGFIENNGIWVKGDERI